MPGASRTQIVLYLAAAALVLWVGASSLRSCSAPAPGGAEPGSDAAQATSGKAAGDSEADGGGLELTEGNGESLVVHVAGAVRRPGLYRLFPNARVGDALKRAGGDTRRADVTAINLAARLVDGQQVLVPAKVSTTEAASGDDSTAVAGIGGGAGAATGGTAGLRGSARLISLASATSEQLETIAGIGPVTAGKILDFRDSKGGAVTIEELDQVPGIGPATMEVLRGALQP